jgi:hypothetical protein
MDHDPTDLVSDVDPEVDADLEHWREGGGKPRVRLLGPVEVMDAQGDLPERHPRRAVLTELAAYLASHPAGATRREMADTVFAEGRTESVQRQTIAQLRQWLGADERGTRHLPPTVAEDRYALQAVLVDMDLFRRLRLRGLARGKDGTEDLWAALRLVTGEPFSNRPAAGYAWLNWEPLDHMYSAMIVDVAHTVATHHLAASEPAQAMAAARAGSLASSQDDRLWLDLIATPDALGEVVEADRVIAQLIARYDAYDLTDLAPTTYRAIQRRVGDREDLPHRLSRRGLGAAARQLGKGRLAMWAARIKREALAWLRKRGQ